VLPPKFVGAPAPPARPAARTRASHGRSGWPAPQPVHVVVAHPSLRPHRPAAPPRTTSKTAAVS